MQQYILDNNIKYFKFENEDECFKYVKYMLSMGYKLEPNYELTFKLVKDDEVIICSYMRYYNNIKNNNDFKRYEYNYDIAYPDYNNNFLNVMNVYHNKYTNDNRIEDKDIKRLDDNNIKHIIYLILDGLGTKILENHLTPDSFLRRHFMKNISAIYPATTVAATTSMTSNLVPLETGWLGWYNYIREADKHLIMFSGYDYFDYSENKVSVLDVKSLIPTPNFYDNYRIPGYIVMPDFTKEMDISNEIFKVKELLNKDKENIMYVYHSMPDSLLHVYGTKSQLVRIKLQELDEKIEDFSKSLGNDTLLIITADHGHIDCPRVIDLTRVSVITDMLERKPQNEARCCAFKVKPGCYNEFPKVFKALFSAGYKLYTKDEFINSGFLGNTNKAHERVDDFLADYVAVGLNDIYFNNHGDNDAGFISHHAGMTTDEMIIPLIYYRGE